MQRNLSHEVWLLLWLMEWTLWQARRNKIFFDKWPLTCSSQLLSHAGELLSHQQQSVAIIVRWVLKFLTLGYKISLNLSIKWIGFKTIAVFCELTYRQVHTFKTLEVWVFKVNFSYQVLSLLLFIPFLGRQEGQVDDQHLLFPSCANFKLGGTWFSKIIPNFWKPHTKLIRFSWS